MNGKFILVFAIIAVIVFSLGYIFDRWLNPWLAKKSVDKILMDIKAGKAQKPRDYDSEIVFDSENISIHLLKNKPANPISTSWGKINRATAFKRDLFSTDCICLLFETTDGMAFEVNEDMKGWLKFLEAMPTHLSGCKPFSDWIFDVASPAFAPNPTEIFWRQ